MDKNFLPVILLCLLSLFFVGSFANAATQIVPSDCQSSATGCSLTDFFTMVGNIYTFIVTDIATTLAVIAIAVGAILMMISAGNPNLLGIGKKVFWSAIIGLVLVYCSYLIIDWVLKTIGITGGLSSLSTAP